MEEWKEIVLPKEVETLDEKYSYQIDENSVVHLLMYMICVVGTYSYRCPLDIIKLQCGNPHKILSLINSSLTSGGYALINRKY